MTVAPADFRGAARRIVGDRAWREVADALECELAAIRAVARVESRGEPFLSSGRPPILFERHIFHRETAGRFDAGYPALSAPSAGGYGAAGDAQYARLRQALELDRRAALRATSWGRFQIMGFNSGLCGWVDVESFVADMCDDEAAQLSAFAGFVIATGLADALRRHDWAAFARGYNGPAYRANVYDEKMAAAYAAELQRGSSPQPLSGIVGEIDTVREIQCALDRLGHAPGPADGLWGPLTAGAAAAFCARLGDSRVKPRPKRPLFIALQAAVATMGNPRAD